MAKKSVQIDIYTRSYRPWIMGGKVDGHIKTKAIVVSSRNVETSELSVDLCEVKSPAGNSFIAEKVSGAIVGSSWDMVEDALRTSDVEVVKGQLTQAVKDCEEAEPLESNEFWSLMGEGNANSDASA